MLGVYILTLRHTYTWRITCHSHSESVKKFNKTISTRYVTSNKSVQKFIIPFKRKFNSTNITHEIFILSNQKCRTNSDNLLVTTRTATLIFFSKHLKPFIRSQKRQNDRKDENIFKLTCLLTIGPRDI